MIPDGYDDFRMDLLVNGFATRGPRTVWVEGASPMDDMRAAFIGAGFVKDKADWDRLIHSRIEPTAAASARPTLHVSKAFYDLLAANGMTDGVAQIDDGDDESARDRALRLRRSRTTGPPRPGMDGRRR